MTQSQDQIPFTIIEYKFERATIGAIKKDFSIDINAPLVYIITSKNEPRTAYIGESTKIIDRLNKHLSSPKKDQYDTIHLIVSARFNRSGTADLERMLITYMFVDELFRLTNSTYGLTNRSAVQVDGGNYSAAAKQG